MAAENRNYIRLILVGLLCAGVGTIVTTTLTVTTLKVKDSDASHTITLTMPNESADVNRTPAFLEESATFTALLKTTDTSNGVQSGGASNYARLLHDGSNAYLASRGAGGIYFQTSADGYLAWDGSKLAPVTNNVAALGGQSERYSGIFANGHVMGLSTLTSGASPYTATASDCVLICNTAGGSITVNLPAAASHAGRIYVIKKTSASNTVTVDPNGAETVDGSATLSWTTNYQSYNLVSDGSNWHIW